MRSCSRAVLASFLAALCGCAAFERGETLPLRIDWQDNLLHISGEGLPGGRVEIWYLEAYCRGGSHDREWGETTIVHQTELVSASEDGRTIDLRCRVEGGVVVDHQIRVVGDGVEFDVRAENHGAGHVDASWVQPCMRVGDFTGRTQETYVDKSFVFVNGELAMLDEISRTEEARYRGGQVYVPPGIEHDDVNPRPISEHVPSNGLIGCFSADDKWILATAWEPYQELFQGVIVCLHSDFRLGGLNPGEVKTARGKVYVIPNDIDDLLTRYEQDF